MVMRNMKHLLPILALICLLRPTTSSAMVRPLPCATEAASFSSTSLQPQSEYVLIPFDFDCDFARQSCRNDPVDFTDPLGLAWWETDNARFNRYSAWRIGASGSPEVRRVNNGKATWQEADRSERQWFFTQANGTWGTVSRDEAERRFVNNAQETLVAGQKMVETWATAEFAIAGAAPAAAEGGVLAVAEELFYDQTIGINPRNVVGLVKTGWRKASSFLERLEIPRGQLNTGIPFRLKPAAVESGADDVNYLYQKVGSKGEHLKFGITDDPVGRYTQEELSGGKLRIVAKGVREEMLRLERNVHETLPIGLEEGQKCYIGVQVKKGLKAPPYK